jgi:hypothetical protein
MIRITGKFRRPEEAINGINQPNRSNVTPSSAMAIMMQYVKTIGVINTKSEKIMYSSLRYFQQVHLVIDSI